MVDHHVAFVACLDRVNIVDIVDSPKVSIITPCFNASNYISQTYRSIVGQTCRNWEWLVTDDCSTDNSRELLLELSSMDKRVKYFRNARNLGAAISRNNSIRHASGEFLAFLDSDDIWLPEKLDRQIAFMADTVNISFTAYRLANGAGEPLPQAVDIQTKRDFDYHDMLMKRATMGCSTVMVRREAFSDLYMPSIRTGQDYALWLKLLRGGEHAYLIPEVLSFYRILPNSISRNKIKKAFRQWQIYRELERLPFWTSLRCFGSYGCRAVFRR